MNKKDEALRIAARFLTAGYYGKPFTRQEMKIMADMCWLAIPMKYRMPKEELDQLKTAEYSIAACERETQHAEHKGTGFCRCTHVMYG
jgi:hypothetical protein